MPLYDFCSGCVWYDAKSDICDVTGSCVRSPDRPPPDSFRADDYELFPIDELDSLRRQYEWELRMEE